MKSTLMHRIPDVSSLQEAPERALLHVLATTTRCARLSLITEFRDLFDVDVDRPRPASPPRAIDLAARELVAHLDALLAAVELYELTLRNPPFPDDDDLF